MESTDRNTAAKSTSEEKNSKNPIPRVEKAYQEIKRMLFVGELVPGQKLRYQDIAKKLKVSQTPVILALTRLENEGLVRSEMNKGFYVPELDLEEAKELYEMRAVIECFLVERTSEHISDKQLRHLRHLMNQHLAIRGESYTRERLWRDARMHLALASFSGHRVGERLLRQIFDRLYLRYRPERLSSSRMLDAEQGHERVYQALAKRRAKEAVEALRSHINRGQKHILGGLQKEVEFRSTLVPWG